MSQIFGSFMKFRSVNFLAIKSSKFCHFSNRGRNNRSFVPRMEPEKYYEFCRQLQSKPLNNVYNGHLVRLPMVSVSLGDQDNFVYKCLPNWYESFRRIPVVQFAKTDLANVVESLQKLNFHTNGDVLRFIGFVNIENIAEIALSTGFSKFSSM